MSSYNGDAQPGGAASLPGAVGMYALSVGVGNLSRTLPEPVYALLSGLNAATVGIVAVSAVQLAEKAIRDKISRILIIFGACAGLCYNALWYFPMLMLGGGLVIAVWDGWLYSQVQRAKTAWRNRHNCPTDSEEANTTPVEMESIQPVEAERSETVLSRKKANSASFIALLVARGQLATTPLVLDLFTSMYLAGTVILGGGPVVIPLLRSYVVAPGWVSGRDFLIGLAIIQAFPGPDFNFAVFLGALALQHTQFPAVFGAFIG
ncbi:CAZyme family AA3 [Penicillium atrosanguineum]|uniref:CAZyme family AA3 n=1 Tax=Penicillium atrosanguineum TaxID=1132637 RepID=UPI0023A3D472|nr:CAZyme family AA3 [Penicillium atrosanguineum]KAJ5313139.1 CAZyme family AA3 [Penicillium atrosanguineum]